MMEEIIKNLSGIPENAYLLVVIILMIWQSKNREAAFNKMITDLNDKNEHAMEKMADALSDVSTALTEVSTIVKANR